MKTKNLKARSKSSQLNSILSQNPAGEMNLARIKFFGMFICALCKMQTVSFEKPATAFETPAKTSPSLQGKRILIILRAV